MRIESISPGGKEPNRGRAVVTLQPKFAGLARRLGEQMGGVGIPETCRRGMRVLKEVLGDDSSDHGVVLTRNKKTGEKTRHVLW